MNIIFFAILFYNINSLLIYISNNISSDLLIQNVQMTIATTIKKRTMTYNMYTIGKIIVHILV